MKVLLILAGFVAVCLANPVTLLDASRITDDILNDPGYLLFERDDGLIEVEDIHDINNQPALTASENDITFFFFTQSRQSGVQIKESQLRDIVRLTGFNIQKSTLVIIHGWRNDGTSAVNDLIKNAALVAHDINVIVVDWSPIAQKSYIVAQASVLSVGNYIGDFLIKLDDVLNHKLSQVTIVGHSLGAHISGNAGARTKGLINNIVGLDPAGPGFTEKNTANRLDPTDAQFVEVIHTNDGRLGFDVKSGHVDYYPNGGRNQKGCGLDLVGSCAHSRAYEYFSESLNNNNFKSRICDTWDNYQSNRCSSSTVGYFGSFPVQKSTAGKYFLATNSRSPFAKG